jgi:hypothetical protein
MQTYQGTRYRHGFRPTLQQRHLMNQIFNLLFRHHHLLEHEASPQIPFQTATQRRYEAIFSSPYRLQQQVAGSRLVMYLPPRHILIHAYPTCLQIITRSSTSLWMEHPDDAPLSRPCLSRHSEMQETRLLICLP